ncbi:MAG: serine acetyltransferase [Clostridiaceae bacterium]|nr:serine acetyltransferase [Clostridiaceae bacterium]
MKEKKITRYYRKANWCWKHHIPIIPGFLMRMCRVLYSIDLPYTCEVGRNVEFQHNGLGCVIHSKAVIGEGTQIYQNVTIGGRNGRGHPVIGKNVFIGASAVILGGVSIGDNAVIGANATVLEDVPAGAVVVGEKAHIAKYVDTKE